MLMGILGGTAPPAVLQILTLFQTKKRNLPHPFSPGIGTNDVIIT